MGAIVRGLALVIAVAALVILIGMALDGTARAATISPDDPIVVVADPEYRDWAYDWQRQARNVRARLALMTDALGMPKPRQVPIRGEFIVWFANTNQDTGEAGTPYPVLSYKAWGQACKARALAWRVRCVDLRYRLEHPGGAGAARWWPLARWLGMPLREQANFITCITGESHGDPTTVGAAGELGISQIHPCHAKTFKRVTGVGFWSKAHTTFANLKFMVWLWWKGELKYGNGWRPWSRKTW